MTFIVDSPGGYEFFLVVPCKECGEPPKSVVSLPYGPCLPEHGSYWIGHCVSWRSGHGKTLKAAARMWNYWNAPDDDGESYFVEGKLD